MPQPNGSGRGLAPLWWVPFLVALAEVIASFIVGYIATVALPGSVGTAIQWGLGFAGPVIALNALLMEFRLEHLLRREVEATVGAQLMRLQQALRIFDAYFSDDAPKLRTFRDEALSNAVRQLESLNRGEAEVQSDAYYRWLLATIREEPKEILAISHRPMKVYLSDPREEDWLQKNRDLAASGRTQIVRLFVLEYEDVFDRDARQTIREHAVRGVKAFVVWKKTIPRPHLQEIEGGGLSIYDKTVVFHDRSYIRRDLGLSTPDEDGPLVPVATVYCDPHSKVDHYVKLFQAMEGLVPHRVRSGQVSMYETMLRDVDQHLASQHGSPGDLEGRAADANSKEALLARQWKGLQEELAAVMVSSTAVATRSRK